MNLTKQIKIVADDKIPFLKGVFEPYANVEYYPGKDISKDKILDADALIVRTRTKCNSELLKGTNVKLITTATIGYDHIDQEYCTENNIRWMNAPGCNSTSVMQYITSVLLQIALRRNFNLREKVIGIIGVGNVGRKVQSVCETLGMNVLLNDPPRERIEGSKEFCSLDQITTESDIITFHVPLNRDGIDKTYHMADEKFFEKLKKKTIIFNSSRGEVVKTSAIKEAIKNGKISNVVLDVWENEPDIDLELLDLVDFATPHIAGYSADGKANGTSVCLNAISEFFNLGINSNWYPENIPFAENGNKIEIDCKNMSEQNIISKVVSTTYSIQHDDDTLRKTPGTFEKQRGDYPIRREFNNYNIHLTNCNDRVVDKLVNLGFKINEN
jgi:erythronate-4-phosphate dehydrogenase